MSVNICSGCGVRLKDFDAVVEVKTYRIYYEDEWETSWGLEFPQDPRRRLAHAQCPEIRLA